MTFIALLGLANALIWPSIWPIAISGLGSKTETASSLLVVAIAGGAIMPFLFGGFLKFLVLSRPIVLLFRVMYLYFGIVGMEIKNRT